MVAQRARQLQRPPLSSEPSSDTNLIDRDGFNLVDQERDSALDEHRPSYLEEEEQETAASLRERQEQMVQQISRIWT